MKDVYCLLTVCLLCKRIAVEPQPIQTARKPFRDFSSCLQRCRRLLVLATKSTNCGEFCRLRPLEESQSKLRSRIRRSSGRKACPTLLKEGDPERFVPKDQIECEFVKDHAGKWTAVVKWNSTNDLSAKVDGYRFSYWATPTEKSDGILCIIIVGKNETQFNVSDGENWTYPMGLAIAVSSYHGSSSYAYRGDDKVAQFWPKACPTLLKEGDPARFVPKDQIKCEFVRDSVGKWTAVVKWNSTNDLSKVDGYRFSYLATPTEKSAGILCRVVWKKQTQFIVNHGENWKYPMGLAITVSSYHANSSNPNNGSVDEVAQFWPTGVGTIEEPQREKATSITVPARRADYLVIILGIIGGLAVTSILIFEYRRRTRRWIITSPPDFRYDAFIIYSSHEGPFVEGVLLPLLEGKFHLTCCIHHRDFMPGESIHQNMADSVTNSRKIITVVSKHFLESNYCNYELQLALQRLLDWKDNCVLVIKVDDVDRKLLPLQLRARSYIDYTDKVERCSWKSRLYKFLSANTTSTSPSSETAESNHSDELMNNNNDQATSSVM